ncbi:GNAT family N-acetyltransferase [Candidatus Saccharibacteria bacterium]|nr:GNAT family N-acetyltransferase [Candidatus Saccharibacteria bacterium]MCL1963165.1 GNAT family N-acetyltransferase [Candidatus Saccharibacteria bacterium]
MINNPTPQNPEFQIIEGNHSDIYRGGSFEEVAKMLFESMPGFEEKLKAGGDHVNIAVDDQGKKLGWIHYVEHDLLDGKPWLKTMEVDENHRRRGIGEALLRCALANLPSDSPIYTMPISPGAVRLLKKIDDPRVKW